MKSIIKIILPLFGLLILMNCDTKTYDEISDVKPITTVVSYNKNVKSIIDNNCVVCHSPTGSNPYAPLTDYTSVKNAVDEILDRIQRPNGDPLKMPQGRTLSQDNINVIIKWKADGLQEN